MTPGLFMAFWISVLCGAEHLAHHGPAPEAVGHGVVQTLCLLLGAMEAGQAESGEPTSGLRAARSLAAVAGAAYMAAVTYFSARG